MQRENWRELHSRFNMLRHMTKAEDGIGAFEVKWVAWCPFMKTTLR